MFELDRTYAIVYVNWHTVISPSLAEMTPCENAMNLMTPIDRALQTIAVRWPSQRLAATNPVLDAMDPLQPLAASVRRGRAVERLASWASTFLGIDVFRSDPGAFDLFSTLASGSHLTSAEDFGKSGRGRG